MTTIILQGKENDKYKALPESLQAHGTRNNQQKEKQKTRLMSAVPLENLRPRWEAITQKLPHENLDLHREGHFPQICGPRKSRHMT